MGKSGVCSELKCKVGVENSGVDDSSKSRHHRPIARRNVRDRNYNARPPWVAFNPDPNNGTFLILSVSVRCVRTDLGASLLSGSFAVSIISSICCMILAITSLEGKVSSTSICGLRASGTGAILFVRVHFDYALGHAHEKNRGSSAGLARPGDSRLTWRCGDFSSVSERLIQRHIPLLRSQQPVKQHLQMAARARHLRPASETDPVPSPRPSARPGARPGPGGHVSALVPQAQDEGWLLGRRTRSESVVGDIGHRM